MKTWIDTKNLGEASDALERNSGKETYINNFKKKNSPCKSVRIFGCFINSVLQPVRRWSLLKPSGTSSALSFPNIQEGQVGLGSFSTLWDWCLASSTPKGSLAVPPKKKSCAKINMFRFEFCFRSRKQFFPGFSPIFCSIDSFRWCCIPLFMHLHENSSNSELPDQLCFELPLGGHRQSR